MLWCQKSALYSEVSAIWSVRYLKVFKVQYYRKAVGTLRTVRYGRCPLFGLSAKRGSTVFMLFSTVL